MKKTGLFLPLIAIAVFTITGCVKESGGLTIKNGVLMVGIEIGYPPMEYMADDGITPAGFTVKLAKAIAGKMELDVQFIDTAWDGIFAAVNTGRFDCIISSVTVTPERLQIFNFSKPYIKNTLVIVMPKNSRYTVNSPYDLSGLNVAYQAATTSEYFMRQLEQEGLKCTLYGYDKVTYCFDDMRFGRIDAIMTDLVVGLDYSARTDLFEIVWQGGEDEFAICMKKGNDALTEEINKALDQLFEDGTMLRISQETFNGLDLVSAVRR